MILTKISDIKIKVHKIFKISYKNILGFFINKVCFYRYFEQQFYNEKAYHLERHILPRNTNTNKANEEFEK